MEVEIKMLAFIQFLISFSQVIILVVQYRVNKSSQGIKWWVYGSVLMAMGFIFMPMVLENSLKIFAMIANPLVVLGQIFFYVGIMRFLDKKERKQVLGLIFIVFLILYYYFIFINNDISARTVVVNVSLATVSITTAYQLFRRKDRQNPSSSNFTACVFLLYGFFLIARVLFALILPPMQTYSDQQTLIIAAFIVPIITGTLWTYGFIIMLNQRLNDENLKEKEITKQLVQQIETERNLAQQNSITDSLTGLANRRFFDEALKTEFFRMKRSGASLSLVMIDVDCFKKFNDNYGHLAGDDCLRRIGNILKTNVKRVPDIAARIGGDEFMLILPETEKNGAIDLAERIRKDTQALAIPHCESDVSQFVTVSIGVISVPTVGLTSPEQVMELADNALYCAKNRGRNLVEVSDDML